MKDCIFCKIVSGKEDCYQIYEDEHFLAFLDIFPFGWGHTQIIPKKHHRYVWDLPNLDQFILVTQKIVQHYNNQENCKSSFAFVIGELVHHAHLQILPVTPQNHQAVSSAVSTIRQPKIDHQTALNIQQKLKLS
jgi:histidine triad (HIT) family protein